MNLKSLRAFYLVVREGSLAAAADKLNLSQPAVSRLVRILEDETKLQLFSRSRRRLVLTPDGELFFREAERILQGIDEIPRIADDVRKKTMVQLRVMTTAPIGLSLIAPSLALLNAEHPETRCVVDIGSRFELESMVGTRNYDLGVMSLPISHSLVSLETKTLCRVQTFAVLPASHPLAIKPSLTADDLHDQPIIALRPNFLWRERIDDFFKAGGVTPNYIVETQSTLIARELVVQGVGIAVMDNIVGGTSTNDGTVLIPLEPERWVNYGYVFPLGQKPNENAERLIQALHQVIETLASNNRNGESTMPISITR